MSKPTKWECNVAQNYFITGASGFIAQGLIPALLQNPEARIFAYVHHDKPDFPEVQDKLHYVYSIQDVRSILMQLGESKIHTVVHLAGAGIADWPWTPKRKEELKNSRWDLVTRLHQSFSDAEIVIDRIFGASAIGFYGDGGDYWLDESAQQGRGFAAELCAGIERRIASAAQEADAKWYALRFGVVLGPDGGLLSRLALPAKLGLGSVFGDGQQWVSWIDRHDLVQAILFVEEHDLESGPLNITSPEPEQWGSFMQHLSGVYDKKTRIRIPSLALSALGEMKSVFLDSARVTPKALKDAGFSFSVPELDTSLKMNLIEH
ncbi:MAG: TIGR01777 family protein [Gammaproteobacteria bacterium]|nr:TIGR01777 family protein [Gammaproteobacteria bacterium]HBF09153.1 TIGR01777 family protein [Gammaproteobacteria bacterium]